MSVPVVSGATINAFCCRNRSGSCALGLVLHLDSNSVHWDCLIKQGSDHRKHKNNEHVQCKNVTIAEGIDEENIKFYKGLMTELKEEVISL